MPLPLPRPDADPAEQDGLPAPCLSRNETCVEDDGSIAGFCWVADDSARVVRQLSCLRQHVLGRQGHTIVDHGCGLVDTDLGPLAYCWLRYARMEE